MTNCNNYVFNGILSRYIVTIIAYFALFSHKNNTIIQKYKSTKVFVSIITYIIDST